jgi:hypothetical protein
MKKLFLSLLCVFSPFSEDVLIFAQPGDSGEDIPAEVISSDGIPKIGTIRSVNGKLYAYIVFLFMDNQHFINQIQEGTVPNNIIPTDDFKIRIYNSYLQSVKNGPVYSIASIMMDVYSNYSHFSQKDIEDIEHALEAKDIVLKIVPYENKTVSTKSVVRQQISPGKPTLGYCIYGKKTLIRIKHPLFEFNEKIYNIQPYIYYDEFSTSNSTFYFDMIYINPEEVDTDQVIARSVIMNRPIDKSLMFVGATVSDNIKACLKQSFKSPQTVKREIWRMFAIHEITHKILNNHYSFYDQVIGEEMALSSSIYANPRLGLAVMYSYLDYNAMNPHRIAALNYLRFLSQETSNRKMMEDPSLVRNLSDQEIMRLTKIHFMLLKRILK